MASRCAVALLSVLATAAAFQPPLVAAPRLAARISPLARHALTPIMQEKRILTEENAIAVLNECMDDLGTMFGSDPQSAKVGITGLVEFVELDGPILVVRLTGRFWHERSRVVERVTSYVLERIPECVDVEIEDVAQLDDADPDELTQALDKAFSEPPQIGNAKM